MRLRMIVTLASLVGLVSGARLAVSPATATDRVQAVASNGPGWATVSAGNNHTCGFRRDHTLWCWGDNRYGQLGIGGTDSRTTPTRIEADADW